MLKISICDDEQDILSKVQEATELFFRTHCADYSIITYRHSDNLLYDLQDGTSYDLFLLDIEMPGMDGMAVPELDYVSPVSWMNLSEIDITGTGSGLPFSYCVATLGIMSILLSMAIIWKIKTVDFQMVKED